MRSTETNLMVFSNYDHLEEIVAEVADRQRRERNVIFYNIEENNGNAANNVDLEKVKSAINTLTDAVNTNEIKIFRLGNNRTAGKTRPIKVILGSSYDALSILKNKSKLKKVNNGISVSSDQTPMQRQYLNHLRAELADRISKGV